MRRIHAYYFVYEKNYYNIFEGTFLKEKVLVYRQWFPHIFPISTDGKCNIKLQEIVRSIIMVY